MRQFVERLSRWRGRSHVQRALEARGYLLPRRYQESVAASGSPDARVDLEKFWDEDAREYVCAAGQVDTATRTFPDFSSYRSQYLDQLASTRKPSSLFPVNPRHPCLREFKVRERTEPGFTTSFVEALQSEKRAEIRRLGIRADLWSGEKEDVGRVFEGLMSARGFSKSKRVFRKQSDSGLVFSGFADLRGRPFCIAVPFHFFVGHSSDELETFEFSPVRAIPGFWFYYGFNTVDAGVLGFQAYTEIIDIMSGSFD
jgi:hypothetical protein